MSAKTAYLQQSEVPRHVAEAESGAIFEPLTISDTAWVAELRGSEPDEQWFAEANATLATATTALAGYPNTALHQQVNRARNSFYGTFLGWDDPENPLHNKHILQRSDGRQHSVPNPRNIVSTAPYLQSKGVKVLRLIGKQQAILNTRPELVVERYQNLEDANLNAAKIINGHQGVITTGIPSINARLAEIDSAVSALGWEGGTTKELVEAAPVVLRCSRSKLRTHVRLFAEHGRKDFTPNQVATLVIAALEAHILTLVSGNEYTAKSVNKLSRVIKGPVRKDMVGDLLGDQKLLEKKIGKKVVRDYLRYAPDMKQVQDLAA